MNKLKILVNKSCRGRNCKLLHIITVWFQMDWTHEQKENKKTERKGKELGKCLVIMPLLVSSFL